jgi:putative PIN family toxin of toxin-antitoxin system
MEAFLQEHFTLVTSEPLLAEIADVLARPHIARRSHLTSAEIAELLQAMRVLAEIVEVGGEVVVCRDPDDDVVIETAHNGRVDVLVTGDRDLTDDPAVVNFLQTAGIRTLTLVDFIRELDDLET